MGLSFTSRGLRTDELTVNNDPMQPGTADRRARASHPTRLSIVSSIPLIVAGLRLDSLLTASNKPVAE